LKSVLRADLQEFALATLGAQLAQLAGRHVDDGAIVVLDNASGDVLAYVGSSGARSSAAQVDGVTAPRQAGSTLKPFLYELAFEHRWLTAASLLDDSPLNLSTPVGVYLPQNYDRDFKGWVSARTALASSLNVPAVRVLVLAGPDAFYERLRALGFDTLAHDAEHYGYALALGGADVTLLALSNAYRTLAAGGVASNVRFLADEPAVTKRRVLAAGATFVVGDILSDPAARALTFGLDNPLATRVWSAVKTGTSKDMRDNWCVGFSSRYTVGVWVGNFFGEPMQDVSGVSGAAPIWRDIIEYLHRQETSTLPSAPHELTRARVDFDDAVEPPRVEWFLAGTALARSEHARDSALDPKIVYPGEGAIIALDPDIPAARQRVEFVAQPRRADTQWILDGDALDAGARIDWEPKAGHHVLVLAVDGRELSRVRFEVRGVQRSDTSGSSRGD
jgi:penicillin-binding protein 1C